MFVEPIVCFLETREVIRLNMLNKILQNLYNIKIIYNFYNLIKGRSPLFIEPYSPYPRWENGHKELNILFKNNTSKFKKVLKDINLLKKDFISIDYNNNKVNEPRWENGWFPALDGMSLYYYIFAKKPETYIEIGSGHSTRFARKAINMTSQHTNLISIDPLPRVGINDICDLVIRESLETTNLKKFAELKENDIVFFDGSHRAFMNSDVTVFFLEVIPLLKPGVIIGIHDIFLPYDYHLKWKNRHYNEQYLLACYLLSNENYFEILFSCSYIHNNKDLLSSIDEIFTAIGTDLKERHPACIWLKKK